MKALLDTNVIVYWMGGVPAFQASLKLAIARLTTEKASCYLSTVSLQEILVFSRTKGTQQEDHEFIRERLATLPFDEPCALEAARLGALIGSPKGPVRRKQSRPTQDAVDLWYRDAAIVGTAEALGFDVILTADVNLKRDFGPIVTAEVRLVEPAIAPPKAAEP